MSSEMARSPMVERVARAIDPASFTAWRRMYDYCIAHGDDEQTSLKYADMSYLPGIEHARIAAKAALNAMREPTEAMVEAHYEAHARATTVMASAEDVWSAMITAALGGE